MLTSLSSVDPCGIQSITHKLISISSLPDKAVHARPNTLAHTLVGGYYLYG